MYDVENQVQQPGRRFPLYSLLLPRDCTSLADTGEPTCVRMSCAGCQQSRCRPKWVHLFSTFQRSVARRLNFRCHSANRGAYRNDVPASLCTFTMESYSAFHVPAFQRNHSKKAGTFSLERSWVHLTAHPPPSLTLTRSLLRRSLPFPSVTLLATLVTHMREASSTHGVLSV